MKRWFSPFMLTLTAIIAAGYAYTAWRLTVPGPGRVLLAVPFVLVWAVPVIYWINERENHGRADDLLHGASYLSMGWLTYVILLCALRDLLLLLTAAVAPELHVTLDKIGAPLVFWGAFAALLLGGLAAMRGPHVRRIDVPIAGLPAEFDGLRIVQISDLHVGPTIGEAYVRRVVEISNGLAPDLVALTGDLVDGSVARLAASVAPLAQLIAHSWGRDLNAPGLYALFFHYVPGFNGLRVPARFAVLVVLGLSVLAGFGVRDLLARARVWGQFLVLALGAFFLAESTAAPIPINVTSGDRYQAPPARVSSARTAPAVYRYVAGQLPKDAVLIELPFGDPSWELRYVYYSTVHWRSLVNGYSGGFPEPYLRFRGYLDDPLRAPNDAFDALMQCGATHLVLHATAYRDQEVAGVRDGRATEPVRHQGGRGADRVPDRADPAVDARGGSLSAARVLLPRAEGARDTLAEELRRAGAEVVEVDAFRTVRQPLPSAPGRDIYKMLLDGEIDVVTFTSPSSVRNFVQALGEDQAADLLRMTIVACIGPVTADACERLEIEANVIPTDYTMAGLVAAIVEHVRGQ